MEPRLCQLERSVGRSRECTLEQCSLWHEGACPVDGLSAELARTPGLAELLLSVRGRLDDATIDRSLLPPGFA
jgi:hypothetical protein